MVAVVRGASMELYQIGNRHIAPHRPRCAVNPAWQNTCLCHLTAFVLPRRLTA